MKIKRMVAYILCVSMFFSLFAIETTAISTEDILNNFGLGVNWDLFTPLGINYNFGILKSPVINYPGYMCDPGTEVAAEPKSPEDSLIDFVGTAPCYVICRAGITGNVRYVIEKSPLYKGGTQISWEDPAYFGGNAKGRNVRIRGKIDKVDDADPDYIVRISIIYDGYKGWQTWESGVDADAVLINTKLPFIMINWPFYIKRVNDVIYQKDMKISIVPELQIKAPGESKNKGIKNLTLFAGTDTNLSLKINSSAGDAGYSKLTWKSENTSIATVVPDSTGKDIIVKAGSNIGKTKISVNGNKTDGSTQKAEFDLGVIDFNTPRMIGQFMSDEEIVRSMNVQTPWALEPWRFNFDFVFQKPGYVFSNFLDLLSMKSTGLNFLFVFKAKKPTKSYMTTNIVGTFENESGIISKTVKVFGVYILERKTDVN